MADFLDQGPEDFLAYSPEDFLSGEQKAIEETAEDSRNAHTELAVGVALGVAFIVWRAIMKRKLRDERPDSIATAYSVANRVWKQVAPGWMKMATPAVAAAYRIAGDVIDLSDEQLEWVATEYAASMGDYLAHTSSKALVEGYTAQVAKNFNPDLAWERVTEAYGLDPSQMRVTMQQVLTSDIDYPTMLTPDNILGKITKMLQARAERIGRQEAWASMQMGKTLVWMYKQQRGDIPQNAYKQWITAEDERVCAICGPLHLLTTGVPDKFVTENGSYWAPSIHFNCRCDVILVIPEDEPEDIAKVDDDWDAEEHPKDKRGRFTFKPKEPEIAIALRPPPPENPARWAQTVDAPLEEKKLGPPMAILQQVFQTQAPPMAILQEVKAAPPAPAAPAIKLVPLEAPKTVPIAVLEEQTQAVPVAHLEEVTAAPPMAVLEQVALMATLEEIAPAHATKPHVTPQEDKKLQPIAFISPDDYVRQDGATGFFAKGYVSQNMLNGDVMDLNRGRVVRLDEVAKKNIGFGPVYRAGITIRKASDIEALADHNYELPKPISSAIIAALEKERGTYRINSERVKDARETITAISKKYNLNDPLGSIDEENKWFEDLTDSYSGQWLIPNEHDERPEYHDEEVIERAGAPFPHEEQRALDHAAHVLNDHSEWVDKWIPEIVILPGFHGRSRGSGVNNHPDTFNAAGKYKLRRSQSTNWSNGKPFDQSAALKPESLEMIYGIIQDDHDILSDHRIVWTNGRPDKFKTHADTVDEFPELFTENVWSRSHLLGVEIADAIEPPIEYTDSGE